MFWIGASSKNVSASVGCIWINSLIDGVVYIVSHDYKLDLCLYMSIIWVFHSKAN